MAINISFIFPISGTFETLDADVIRVTALMGLLTNGPLLYSLILSNAFLFYSVRAPPKLLFYGNAHALFLSSSGLTDPYLFIVLMG